MFWGCCFFLLFFFFVCLFVFCCFFKIIIVLFFVFFVGFCYFLNVFRFSRDSFSSFANSKNRTVCCHFLVPNNLRTKEAKIYHPRSASCVVTYSRIKRYIAGIPFLLQNFIQCFHCNLFLS